MTIRFPPHNPSVEEVAVAVNESRGDMASIAPTAQKKRKQKEEEEDEGKEEGPPKIKSSNNDFLIRSSLPTTTTALRQQAGLPDASWPWGEKRQRGGCHQEE